MLIVAAVLAFTALPTFTATAQQSSNQDSLGILAPADSAFGDAEVLKEILVKHGFVVHRIFRSLFQAFGRVLGTWREAVFVTNRGDFNVLFFPPPNGAERIKVKEARAGRVWRYTFPNHPQGDLPGANDTLYAHRMYFVQAGRWFIMADNPDLAETLREVLSRL